MNNEPVAWMMGNPQNTSAYLTFEKPTREMKISHQAIPLYTHPAKTLTDAEIRIIQDMCHLKNVGYNNFIMRFARAILRKASEK